MVIVFGVLAVVGGVVALVFSHRENARIKLITDTPTSRSDQIRTAGYYEVKGKIEAQGALTMPGTGKDCVYFHVTVEEEVVSGRGDRRHRSWRTVRREGSDCPFFVRDGAGTIEVMPSGAEIDAPQTFYDSERMGMFEGMFTLSGGCTGRRIAVRALETGTSVYVLGPVRRIGQRLVFQRSGNLPFIISSKTENELVSSKKTSGYALLVGGFIAIVGGIGLILANLR